MKNRIIGFLSLLFAVFSLGAIISMLYIAFTTTALKKIITLHSVEILRQDLIIKIQNVEQDLLTVHTELSSKMDKIVENVTDLDSAINRCAGCHHSPLITRKLSDIAGYVQKFETSLSYYITAAADDERIRSLKLESYNLGRDLLGVTSEMALIANQRLQERTQKAIDDVQSAQRILIVTLVISFILGLWIAYALTKRIISPIRELTVVSRKIASGELGYTTSYRDPTEFGELASSLNEMSLSLKESNEKIVQHMNRLAGLYRVTLPFHSVSNVTDIFREVSYGVADLVEVEQCGIMLPDAQQECLEHKYPAFGLDEAEAKEIRVRRAEILRLYDACNKRPLIIDTAGMERLPAGMLGSSPQRVRSMLLGWVRLKEELVGVIRLVNRKNGGFLEDSARLIGIISNNVSVALENMQLYEDLKAQMQELRETQEQLVQAAKLAAIGELASNVAHEINNPLTSIMGYAELIKEESNLEYIMRDIEIIEKESLRAREIVKQLLEFARRRPLEIREVDVNTLLQEVISLVSVHLKDARVQIAGSYGELPCIMGDPNQLKQVFLNLLNNAVHALTENGPGRPKRIDISTYRTDSAVSVEISDTGSGIPADVLPKIFEPFFTTKREKGTGLGLSITYKIIQSHQGKIGVKSDPGTGSTFVVSLPVHNTEGLRLSPAAL